MKKNVVDIEKHDCTGCKLCKDVCSRNAIHFETDDLGFWYPVIDEKKCNECGLCRYKCPSLNSEKLSNKNILGVYAAWSKKSEVRTESTSGGIFWELAHFFIENGGYVVGARWDDDYKSASYLVTNDEEGLQHLRGSKYIQSDADGIYKIVKELLDENKKIMFCGSPCYIAAMQMYIGDSENIWYFDYICRNANSPLALKSYLENIESETGSKVIKLRQKSKKTGWTSLATNVQLENGQEIHLDKNEDLWIKGFIKNDLYTRDSCFSCKYRSLPRKTADITVGDFWGINNVSMYDMFKGISVVLINTERGDEWFRSISEKVFVETHKIEDVMPGNKALLNNPIDKPQRKEFLKNLNTHSFKESYVMVMHEEIKMEKSIEQQLSEDKVKYKKSGEIDEELYVYLNYNCENVIRKGKAKIIPYTNAIIDIDKTARIELDGDDDFEVGANKLKGSSAETYIRMDKYSRIIAHHGGYLFYGTTLELKESAIFETGYFSANTGSVIVATKKIYFGEDVMIGRNVIFYDSDFHRIFNSDGIANNNAEEIHIDDHVWLTSNINVNKGVHIGEGTLVAAQTVVNKNYPEYSLVAGGAKGKVFKSDMRWSRNVATRYADEFKNRRVIQYGFGVEGKAFFQDRAERIEIIIDNKETGDKIISFDKFNDKYSNDIKANCQDWICVIASTKYYAEILDQVKCLYPELLVVGTRDV